MILLTYDVKRYRELLGECAKEKDIVIEIGPHTGASTKVLAEKAKKVIAVDKADQAEKALEKALDNVTFVKGDVRYFETVRKVQGIVNKCDLLAFDMGGGRYPDTVFKVWGMWSGVFRPRDSIIRNRGIAEFLQRAEIADDSLKRRFKDSGWLAE
ncbi:MAG: SAM-dependent methyltransferase, partial [Candidatus Altiarchaeota archaeon]|nr:SAM-dependent methyltransferase [Candidatus Altiarchaeota archaeon]